MMIVTPYAMNSLGIAADRQSPVPYLHADILFDSERAHNNQSCARRSRVGAIRRQQVIGALLAPRYRRVARVGGVDVPA